MLRQTGHLVSALASAVSVVRSADIDSRRWLYSWAPILGATTRKQPEFHAPTGETAPSGARSILASVMLFFTTLNVDFCPEFALFILLSLKTNLELL